VSRGQRLTRSGARRWAESLERLERLCAVSGGGFQVSAFGFRGSEKAPWRESSRNPEPATRNRFLRHKSLRSPSGRFLRKDRRAFRGGKLVVLVEGRAPVAFLAGSPAFEAGYVVPPSGGLLFLCSSLASVGLVRLKAGLRTPPEGGTTCQCAPFAASSCGGVGGNVAVTPRVTGILSSRAARRRPHAGREAHVPPSGRF